MIVQNSSLFVELSRELLSHSSHRVRMARYGDTLSADWLGVECQDCRKLLVEFLPSANCVRDPEQVRYEGHYDEVRDVCYVEVFKPGKAPYPLQERQDIINHSPTGISWGYGGSGPAQCALAILLDYLADGEEARAQYHDFKFKVIALLPRNAEWTLTGRDIERALQLKS
jgi:Family of unknown function (DUF6166)